MKGIKTLFGVLAVAGLLFSGSAFAQENGNRDENGKIVRGPYETNGFWDNWFIGVGGGVQTAVDIFGTNWKNDTFKCLYGGIAADLFVGKWITPTVGVRVGYKGLTNGTHPLQGLDAPTTKMGASTNAFVNAGYWQHAIHADFLWNISNSFSGYKETRFWDVIGYFQAGVVNFKTTDKPMLKNGLGYEAGFGFINDFRLGKHVDLYLDLSLPVVRDYELGITGDRSAKVDTDVKKFLDRYGFLPSATLGLIFNLGRTNFDRHSSVTPVVIPVPFTTEQYNALKARVEELEKENAALKDEIEALKNQAPDTVYVGTNNVESPAYAFFEMGSAKLSDREKLHLDFFCDNVVANLADDKGLLVSGSADSKTGSAKRNTQLSEQRANAVKDYLVKKGVAADRIETEVLGGIAGDIEARRVVVSVK
ncbi:MAG: OmpA family protein [Bacteroidales bacterium]|nr:OmpA family protein [Bacteroidales bacterium]